MKIDFYKYQGTGNDFIMIDNRMLWFPAEDERLVARLCHRRFGIGADGLILIQQHPDYQFEMIYFNADGRPGSLCGNGARCTVAFAHRLGIINNTAHFLAADGPHEARIDEAHLIWLQMADVQTIKPWNNGYFLNTGSPHVVQFEQQLANFPVYEQGKHIRNLNDFAPSGTNVNFAEIQSDSALYVRTYERGVEDETYSCGTGVTAAALAYSAARASSDRLGKQQIIDVHTIGGNLKVAFRHLPESFSDIWLIGPAEYVFSGTIN
ncbi:diaminopimelate epimerase [Rhodoflexus sp.]